MIQVDADPALRLRSSEAVPDRGNEMASFCSGTLLKRTDPIQRISTLPSVLLMPLEGIEYPNLS
jgi:hypothetical protein